DFVLDDDGSPIDEITAIPYFAPKSYTAEEMVEIICHGGFAASRTIIDRLVECGARLAEPGEFTRRAFVNGRISLSQVEAVIAAIEAKSELALKAAARNLKGDLYKEIESIRSNIGDTLTLIEAEIDFSEEEIDKTSSEKIASAIKEQYGKSSDILKSYDFGRGLNQGYRIAIVGRANVGKSSLMNALLKRDRAIVTEIPGTTRDTLTEWIDLDGFPILLTDTAGLRESGDMVERIGQERTRQEIENSDLVIFMLDGSTGITDEDNEIYGLIKEKLLLIVINKIDLGLADSLDIDSQFTGNETVSTSALIGTGLSELERKIEHILSIDEFNLDTAILATERQYRAMKNGCDVLGEAISEIESGSTEEVLATFLREVLDHLSELVGETTSDDILNNIFDRFCIGK
ncbi:MAG: tRNA uridine-5-carboxymethylaminomethyl(34) synthesis GTPase MnmE, partial [candidate division Zixibacteria bacterium]